MKAITRDHTDNATIERYGDGVAVLDMDGHLRELKYSVPLSPRATRRASWSGVVDGMGNVQHPIGFLDGEERTDRTKDNRPPAVKEVAPEIIQREKDIVAQWEAGISVSQIARKYNGNHQMVRRVLSENGYLNFMMPSRRRD